MSNKYQEALDILCLDGIQFLDKAREFCHKYGTSMKATLQELVDKETPMKRKKIYDEVLLSSYSICPKCNSKVSPICCYCENCGQKLDWGEYE